MNRFQTLYQQKVRPALQAKFGYVNLLAVPRIVKVTLNIGASKAIKDENYWKIMEGTLAQIAGQKAVKTVSRKAISGFGIRMGQPIGIMVTLRREKMYSFLDKLVNITLPRVRDFRGIPTYSVDACGNLAIGIKEHIVFPEIDPEQVEKTHGLEVTIHVSADGRDRAVEMYRKLGFPLADDLVKKRRQRGKKIKKI